MNVVERPRRKNFASRGAAALCVGMAFTFVGGSAWAASCIPAHELIALRTAALQQQLAIAALQCNRGAEFQRFVQIYGEPLRGADEILLGFFKKRNMLGGTSDHSAFKNSLAKLWAVSSSKDNVDFCNNADVAFRMANNATPVPLHAIAANIPAGRYVACAPGVNSPKQTLTASAERKIQVAVTAPAKKTQPRILREDAVRDTFAVRNKPAAAKAEIRVVESILPTRKPLVVATAIVVAKEKKQSPVQAKAAPKPSVSVAAGPGVPLSQYAMKMADAQNPPRSPYEASPEELMTEADLPLENAPPVAAPTARVAKTALVAKADGTIPEQRIAQPVRVAEAVPEEIAEAPAPAAQPTAQQDYAPWVAEQYAPPREIRRQPQAAETREYYERPDDRYQQREPDYAPRQDRYGNSGSDYRQQERAPQEYRERYYEEAPRYRAPQRPMRDRYASAPDYSDAEYDRYDSGYSQREDRYYDPYYER